MFEWKKYEDNLPFIKRNSFETHLLRDCYISFGAFNSINEVEEKIKALGRSTEAKPFEDENLCARLLATYKIWFGEIPFFEALVINQTL